MALTMTDGGYSHNSNAIVGFFVAWTGKNGTYIE